MTEKHTEKVFQRIIKERLSGDGMAPLEKLRMKHFGASRELVVQDLPFTRKKKGKTAPKWVVLSPTHLMPDPTPPTPWIFVTTYKKVLPAAYFIGMLVDQ